MTNRYRQGFLAELELVKTFKTSKEFHTVLRSAGSRSAFDVVAFGDSSILVCQVKTGRGSYKAALDRLKTLKVPNCVTKQLRIYTDRTWLTIEIT